MKLKSSLWILLIIGLISCKQKITEKEPSKTIIQNGIKIIDIGNIQNLEKFKVLHLGKIYPNPLNSENASESKKKAVIDSWTNLINQLSDFMEKEKFDWETESKVRLYQKIYFSENGEVEYYTFNVKNENVTPKKKKEFAELLEQFSKNLKFGMKSEKKYWQCGTTVY